MSGSAGGGSDVARSRDVTVVELLDRLLDKGVVLAGDLTISVAGVDLVELSLRVLLCSTDAAERAGVPTPSETDAMSADALGSSALASRALDADALHADAFDSGALHTHALDSQAEDPDGTASGALQSGALGADMLGSPDEEREE